MTPLLYEATKSGTIKELKFKTNSGTPSGGWCAELEMGVASAKPEALTPEPFLLEEKGAGHKSGKHAFPYTPGPLIESGRVACPTGSIGSPATLVVSGLHVAVSKGVKYFLTFLPLGKSGERFNGTRISYFYGKTEATLFTGEYSAGTETGSNAQKHETIEEGVGLPAYEWWLEEKEAPISMWAEGPEATSPSEPPALGEPALQSHGCNKEASSIAEIETDIEGAVGGEVVCVTNGTYGAVKLKGEHASEVELRPKEAGKVTFHIAASSEGIADGLATDKGLVYIAPGTSNLTVHGFKIEGPAGEVAKSIDAAIDVAMVTQACPGSGYGNNPCGPATYGNSKVRIDANEISGGGQGVEIEGENYCSPHNVNWGTHKTECEANTATGASVWGLSESAILSHNYIHGFGGNESSEDAVRIANYKSLRITGNKITEVNQVYSGIHSDSIQSFYGGSKLTIDHNWLRESTGDFLLLKDGDIEGITVFDNLSQEIATAAGENAVQIWCSTNTVFQRNTVWLSSTGAAADVFPRCTKVAYEENGSTLPYGIEVAHNVVYRFRNGEVEEHTGVKWTNNGNGIYNSVETEATAAGSDEKTNVPTFKCGKAGEAACQGSTPDWRLATNPKEAGIDWETAAQHYGP